MMGTDEQRFLAKCRRDPEMGCILWMAGSQFRFKSGVRTTPGTASWILACGPVPGGFEIRRTCSAPGCVLHVAALPSATANLAVGRRFRLLSAEDVDTIRNLPDLRHETPEIRKSVVPDLCKIYGISMALFHRIRCPGYAKDVYREVGIRRARYNRSRWDDREVK